VKNSTAQMHKIVLGLAGVMSLFVITIPLAMLRVSATQKFAGQPLRSQTCEAHTPISRKVLSWLECARMNVPPLPDSKH
jgi:hypothetical protein